MLLLFIKTTELWTSLVVQWIRNHLPMEGTQVQSLVWENSAYHGAFKPVHHNYWAHALEPACRTNWSPCAWSLYSITREVTPVRSLSTAKKSSPLSLQLEKACAEQWGPSAVKTKQNNWLLKKQQQQQNSDCEFKGRFLPLYQNFFFPNYFYKCIPCTEFLADSKIWINEWRYSNDQERHISCPCGVYIIEVVWYIKHGHTLFTVPPMKK